MCILKKVGFSLAAMAAIFDLAITPFVALWRTSTSLIYHVQGPINSFQVRNSPNTKLRTGLQASHWITSRKCEQQYRQTLFTQVENLSYLGFFPTTDRSFHPHRSSKYVKSSTTCTLLAPQSIEELKVLLHLRGPRFAGCGCSNQPPMLR